MKIIRDKHANFKKFGLNKNPLKTSNSLSKALNLFTRYSGTQCTLLDVSETRQAFTWILTSPSPFHWHGWHGYWHGWRKSKRELTGAGRASLKSIKWGEKSEASCCSQWYCCNDIWLQVYSDWEIFNPCTTEVLTQSFEHGFVSGWVKSNSVLVSHWKYQCTFVGCCELCQHTSRLFLHQEYENNLWWVWLRVVPVSLQMTNHPHTALEINDYKSTQSALDGQ